MADPHLIYLPVARALQQTSLLRERLLPRPGTALVKEGDRVEPVDTVARTFMPMAPFVVNIAQLFQVPSLRAHSLLLKKVGDTFAKDEVLARKKNLVGRSLVCRAPSTGRLLAEHRGEVLLELAPTQFDLPANVKGMVTKVVWMNPHIWIYIDSKDDKGNLVQWQCEGGPPNSLTRQGWTRNSLKAGDNVTIDGLMAKTRENTCNSSRVTLPDGKRVFARSPEDAK